MTAIAWRVEINYMSCIVAAETKSKARMKAILRYWEAGYGRGRGTWPSGISVEREPRFDGHPTLERAPNAAYNESYL